MRAPLLCMVIAIITGTGQAQTLDWAVGFGTDNYDFGREIESCRTGGWLIYGVSHDSATFYPQVGAVQHVTSNGPFAFIAKVSEAGYPEWHISLEGTYSHHIRSTSSGFLVSGSFYNGADLDPGPEVDSVLSVGQSAFISRFDHDGNYLSSFQFGEADVKGSAMDHHGNVYVTGEFTGVVDFNPGAVETTLDAGTSIQGFVAKYSASDELIWANKFGSIYDDQRGVDIAVNSDGDVFVAGAMERFLTLGEGNDEVTINCHGESDSFVAKYDTDGNFDWVTRWGSKEAEWTSGLALSAQSDIYAFGTFEDSCKFEINGETVTYYANGANNSDAVLVKLNPEGQVDWAKTWGSDENDVARDISVDPLGFAYCSGNYQGTCDFDPGTGIDINPVAGSFSGFISKFDPLGNFMWVETVETQCSVNGIAIDSLYNVAGVGEYTWELDNPGMDNDLVSLGERDIFVLHFDQDVNLSVENLNAINEIDGFPNPTTGLIQLNFNEIIDHGVVRIGDIHGRVVTNEIVQNATKFEIELVGPPGMYVVQFETSKESKLLKVVKL